MSKYKIYLTTNGKKEKIDETNSLKDFGYLWNEYKIAYPKNAILTHNVKW